MKKYLINTLLFFLIPLIFFIIGVSIHFIIIRNNEYWEIEKDYQYIVLGSSQPECAFNDSYIDKLLNLSSSAESYFYTYLKMKKILDYNKNVKTVFIQFDLGDISIGRNQWIWGKGLAGRFPRYLPLMEKKELELLISKNFTGILSINPKFYLREVSNSLLSIFSNKGFLYKKRYGGYNYLIRDKIEEDIKNNQIKDHHSKSESAKISQSNIQYLLKLINFIKSKSIQIFFIKTPVHSFYYQSIKNDTKTYNHIKEKYFYDIETLDFSSFQLGNENYGDLNHLNYKGSEVFSKWFNKLIRDGLFNNVDKQKIIDEQISLNKIQKKN